MSAGAKQDFATCNGGWECVSAVHDGRCSPWVMCSCSVVRGNQIHDSKVNNIT